MSALRERNVRLPVGQLLLVGFRPEEESTILAWVAEGKLGGVILFERNAADALEVVRLSRAFREAGRHADAGLLPLVAVDQEGGRIWRIKRGVTHFPGAGLLGRLDRPQTTGRVARWIGGQLAALGVHMNLAPVADVSAVGCRSRVLEGRTFGSDPARVARHARAWIRGSQSASVAACTKHFPGHGAVAEDSHLALPRDASSMEAIECVHLPPFAAAVRAGVAAVMVSHVAYEGIDPGRPACLSSEITQGLLRGRLGFRGLAITDDLEMGAVSERWDPLTAAVESLRAGADMALVGRNLRGEVRLDELLGRVAEAARRGVLPEGRLKESIDRVMAFKRRWIPSVWTPPEGPLPSSSAQRFARRLWSFDSQGGHSPRG